MRGRAPTWPSISHRFGVAIATTRPQVQDTQRIVKNDSATFIAFLTILDQHTDPDLTIHLVLDNGSSHTSKATKKWLADHPRFQPHYIPKKRQCPFPGQRRPQIQPLRRPPTAPPSAIGGADALIKQIRACDTRSLDQAA